MNENSKLQFFDELTALLKGRVKPKSEDVINGENFCDALKMRITRICEKTYKLGLFGDDSNFTSYIAENVNTPLERMKVQMEKTWLRDKLTIGLMGHFSTGKTTALNLLFGENFQTDNHENTALATYLTYGSRTNVITLVDKSEQSQELTLDEFGIFDYDKGVSDFPFARIFNYAVKENDNLLLKELTMIDTPGLFSTQTGHSEPTKNVVSNCDIIFWFINIAKYLPDADLKFLKESLGCKPVYIIFSFTDARGTVPCKVKASIDKILLQIKRQGIDCKGYLTLGKKEEIKRQFQREAHGVLNKLVEEYTTYDPYRHVMNVVQIHKKVLTDAKQVYTESMGEIDTQTDKLLADYKASMREFETEVNNCVSRFNNIVDTFNDRCKEATFCGGASGALCNNLKSIQRSLHDMIGAYNAMDESKLIQYGDGVSKMNLDNSRLHDISEVLSDIIKLENDLN